MRNRNISFKMMIFLLIIIISVGVYAFINLTKLYYTKFENKESSVFIEKEQSNTINVFGYEFNIDNFNIFTK